MNPSAAHKSALLRHFKIKEKAARACEVAIAAADETTGRIENLAMHLKDKGLGPVYGMVLKDKGMIDQPAGVRNQWSLTPIAFQILTGEAVEIETESEEEKPDLQQPTTSVNRLGGKMLEAWNHLTALAQGKENLLINKAAVAETCAKLGIQPANFWDMSQKFERRGLLTRVKRDGDGILFAIKSDASIEEVGGDTESTDVPILSGVPKSKSPTRNTDTLMSPKRGRPRNEDREPEDITGRLAEVMAEIESNSASIFTEQILHEVRKKDPASNKKGIRTANKEIKEKQWQLELKATRQVGGILSWLGGGKMF